MSGKGKWFGPACLALLLAGCIQPVSIMPPDRAVAVKCILTNDTLQTVSLFYSGAIGATVFDPVENASVEVSESGGRVHAFSYEGEGRYLCDFRPFPGKDYRLQVVIPGGDTLSATTTFPQEMRIQSQFFPPSIYVDESYWDLENITMEDASRFNKLFPWGYGISRKQIEEVRRRVDASVLARMPGIVYYLDSPYPDAMYIVGINEIDGKKVRARALATNHLFVDHANQSKSGYRCAPDADTSIHRRYEDAMGASYNGLPLHTDYLRIAVPTDEYDNGLGSIPRIVHNMVGASQDDVDASPFFVVVGDIAYNYWWEDARSYRSSLYFCAVSPEYDHYMQDCWKQTVSAEGDLLATLYVDASRIYTNVQGGYGVFGAMNVLRHDCDLQRIPAGTGSPLTRIPFDCCLAYPAYTAPLPEL